MRITEAEKAGIEPEAALVGAEVEQVVLEHAKKYGVDVSNVFQKFSLFLISEEAGRNAFTEISNRDGALEGAVMVNIVTQEEYKRLPCMDPNLRQSTFRRNRCRDRI